MNIKNKAKEIIEAGKKLVSMNLVQGTWGNISVRLDNKHMLLTPSGVDYLDLQERDLIIMNTKSLTFESINKPSSEKDIHAQIYNKYADINAVLHAHPTYSSTIACLKKDIPTVRGEEGNKSLFADKIAVSKYALPSTKKLAKNVLQALNGYHGCIIANHGVAVCGINLQQAFVAIDIIEKSAKLYIEEIIKKKLVIDNFSKESMLSYFEKRYNKCPNK